MPGDGKSCPLVVTIVPLGKAAQVGNSVASEVVNRHRPAKIGSRGECSLVRLQPCRERAVLIPRLEFLTGYPQTPGTGGAFREGPGGRLAGRPLDKSVRMRGGLPRRCLSRACSLGFAAGCMVASFWVLATGCWAGCSVPVNRLAVTGWAAQDERPSAATESASRIQVSPLETYYIPDKEGRLIPVFQFPFEEFERLLRQERGGAPSEVPSGGFRVVQANFVGQVNADLQRATVRLRLRLILNQSGWQPIPLGLPGWVVDGSIQGPASVSHYLSRNEAGGLVLHVAGPAEEVLEFSLPLSARVLDLGAVQQLPIAFPYPTELAFNLTIPTTSIEVRGGDVADLQTTVTADATVVRLRELNERSMIAWQAMKGAAQAVPIKARVDSALRVQALGERAWQVSAQINVVPLDNVVAELVVGVPTNAENFLSPQSSVRVQRVPAEELQRPAGALPAGYHFYRLSLDDPLTEATPLQLTYNVVGAPSADVTSSRVQLGGPVWLDCLFAPGTLELAKDRELSTVWQLAGGISPRPTVRDNPEITLFNIERPDFRLELLNRPQAAQVRVTSEYELIVTQRIVLTARFHCQIQGKFSEPLWIDPGEWQFVLGDPGIQARDGRLMIDPSVQAVSSDGDLTFRCTLELETPDPFRLNLPRLQGEVALVQQPGRVLLVLGDPSKSFQFAAADSTLLQDATTPMQFRARDANSDWILSGQIGLRPRLVVMEQWAQLSPESQFISDQPQPLAVTQTVQLEVSHQPLTGLAFLLPSDTPLPQLQLQLNGEIVAFKATAIVVAGRAFQAIEFALPPERLRGRLSFSLSHLLEPAVEATDAQTRRFDLPLAQLLFDPLTRLFSIDDPVELEQHMSQQLAGVQIRSREIRTPWSDARGLVVNSADWGAWRSLSGESGGMRWIPAGPWPSQAALSLTPAQTWAEETTVEQVHVRTWWSGDQRREQWTASVVTNQTRLELSVPPSIDVRRVLVDGRGVNWEAQRRPGRLVVEWETVSAEEAALVREAETETLRQHQVEVWYSLNQPIGPWTQVLWQAPRLPNQEWCRQFTWEVAASDWWQWVWASSEWTPAAQTVDFNSAVDALAAEASPSVGWVFASHFAPESGSLLMANRRWLRTATIVGVALVVMCSWLLGWYRAPPFWLLLAGGLIGIAWQFPQVGSELAPWAAAAILGSLLVVGLERLTRETAAVSPTPVYELNSETTRTYWADPDSGQERSGPSQSQRGSLVGGENSP